MIQLGGDKGLRDVFGKTNALKKELKVAVDVHGAQSESASNDIYDLQETIKRLDEQREGAQSESASNDIYDLQETIKRLDEQREERMGDLNASNKSLTSSKSKQHKLDNLVAEFTEKLEDLL